MYHIRWDGSGYHCDAFKFHKFDIVALQEESHIYHVLIDG